MQSLEQVSDFVVGRVTFPLLHNLYNRRRILSTYQRLMVSERYPQEELRELQLRKLQKLLRNANRWVPYYTAKFRESNLAPEDIRTLEDINHIPPLSRQDVNDHLYNLVDVRHRASIAVAEQSGRARAKPIPFARFRRHKLVRNCTTGSTGAPTFFFEDGGSVALSWANELRVKSWYGLHPGAREARFALIPTDDQPTSSNERRLRKLLWHQVILPGVNLTDEDHASNLRILQEFRPRILWGVTTAMTGLADYIKRSQKKETTYRPELMVTWAAPLYEHEKSLLEEVFQCPATNIYGTREVGLIAARCPHGSLHVNQEHYYVECVGNGAGDTTYAPGEILVTPLFDSPMPFIRYRVGDLGEMVSEACSCGRTLQVMSNLVGRTGDVFTTKDGRVIVSTFWSAIFGRDFISRSLERYQVVYRKDASICLRIVRNSNYSDETEAELRDHLAKHFHPDTQFEFDYVPAIDPQPSGKYALVVNEFK